jgi:hypothetical protein
VCPEHFAMGSGLNLQEITKSAPLGINLSSVSYYSSEMVFTDIFKQSQVWQESWDDPEQEKQGLLLDDQGWVEMLAPGQKAETLLCRVEGHYPAGVYTCSYQGQGDIELDFDAQVIARKPGKILFRVDSPSAAGIALRLKETDIFDPVRHLQVFLPGFAEDSLFHPLFLEHWRGFAVLRFMDWMQTNNSEIKTWEDRPNPKMQSQASEKGVALEYMIHLANMLHADPWFCIPHRASEDFVRRFAQMVKEQLDSNLKVYIEYSNEVWNCQFDQAQYCQNLGVDLELSQDPYQAQLFYYSKRAVEIFQIWEEVFGHTARLIRVLSGQFSNPWVSEQILSYNQAYRYTDALAVAPYFGQSLGSPENADYIASTSVDYIFDACAQEISESEPTIAEQADLAESFGVKLIAYEGGQHLVGYNGGENNEQLTDLFIQANQDKEMEKLYRRHLKTWYQNGGGIYAMFSSVGLYSKWGSWGLLEHHFQDGSSAPKYRACMKYVQKRPKLDPVKRLSFDPTNVWTSNN